MPTVSIIPSPVIACPGLPTEIKAVGNPPGGAFAWLPIAPLVNLQGQTDYLGSTVHLRDNSVNTVHLWDFKKDDTTGRILEKTLQVSVTYLYQGTPVRANASVLIHKIDFEVKGATVRAGVTAAYESDRGVQLLPENVPTISTMPTVTIKLDKRCPKPNDCASNHRVGWLQTLTACSRVAHYDHTRVDHGVRMIPIRDIVPQTIDRWPAAQRRRPTIKLQGKYDFPFYDGDLVKKFLYQDGLETQVAEHQDSPGFDVTWDDPRTRQRALRRIIVRDRFTAWLAVQNIAWSRRHPNPQESLIFLKHFDWAVNLSIDVDWDEDLGKRCKPHSRPPEPRPIVLRNGQGATTPNWSSVAASALGAMTLPEQTIEDFDEQR